MRGMRSDSVGKAVWAQDAVQGLRDRRRAVQRGAGMNLADAAAEFGWQAIALAGVVGLAIITAFAVGLTIGRRIGRNETPHVAKKAIDRLTLQVVRWRERYRAEVKARESVEERHARLRGALRVYEEEAV